MTTKLTIFPYKGISSLKFGMTPKEINDILGDPDSISVNKKSVREYRNNSNIQMVYQPINNTLVEMSFGKAMDTLYYKDINIFNSPSDKVLKYLCEEDGSPYIYVGFIIFIKLGITITGFHDNDEFQKALVVFKEGRLNHLRHKFKSYHM